MSKNFAKGKFKNTFRPRAGVVHQNLLDAWEFKSIHSHFKFNPAQLTCVTRSRFKPL